MDVLEALTDKIFQSTLSVRRATWDDLQLDEFYRISIHALREESDLEGRVVYLVDDVFQSTLSVRRATCGRARSSPGPTYFNPRSP